MLLHYAAAQAGMFASNRKLKVTDLCWCAHCLLPHLTLVHVPRALVEIAVGGQRCHDAEQGSSAGLCMCEV